MAKTVYSQPYKEGAVRILVRPCELNQGRILNALGEPLESAPSFDNLGALGGALNRDPCSLREVLLPLQGVLIMALMSYGQYFWYAQQTKILYMHSSRAP